MRGFKTLLLINYYSGYQVKQDRMGGVCGMYMGENKHIKVFVGKT